MIDDEESVRESLRGLLETISLNVALFKSVEAFLSANPPVLPSCIVLDVRLPGASGFELQKQLVEAHVDTPIVFITGHGDIPMSVRAMKAGAIEFLSKPFGNKSYSMRYAKGSSASVQASLSGGLRRKSPSDLQA